jgi:hypothetical protein
MIELPGTYAQINVGQLAAYLAAKDDFDKVAAITGKTRAEVKGMPMVIVEQAVQLIEAMIATEKEHQTFQPVVKIRHGLRRVSYGFIPNLDSVTAAEYIDFILFSESKNFRKNIVNLAALMYRPITIHVGNKYQIQDYDTDKVPLYVEDIKRMPASVFSGALLFFSILRKELNLSSLESLSSKMRKVNQELVDNL